MVEYNEFLYLIAGKSRFLVQNFAKLNPEKWVWEDIKIQGPKDSFVVFSSNLTPGAIQPHGARV
jgi:hypothetical protein